MMIETTPRPAAKAFGNYAFKKEPADNRLTKNVAEKFIAALTELESARDVELLVALFADDCEVGNIVVSEKFRGVEGARRFWTSYRAAFKDVCSIFQNEIYSGNTALLEWTTEGRIKNGRKIRYDGASYLEMKGEKIARFHAAFDPKNLERQMTRHESNDGRAGR